MKKIIYILILLPMVVSAQLVEFKYPLVTDTLKKKITQPNLRLFGGGSIDVALSGTMLVSANLLKWNIKMGDFYLPIFISASTSQNVFQQEIDYQQLAINNIIDPNGGTLCLTLNKYIDLMNIDENNIVRFHTSIGGRFFPSYRNGVVDLMGGINANTGIMFQSILWHTTNPRNSGIGYIQGLIQGAFMDGNILRKTFVGISSNLLAFYSLSAGLTFNKNIRLDYMFSAFIENYDLNDFTGTRSRIGVSYNY